MCIVPIRIRSYALRTEEVNMYNEVRLHTTVITARSTSSVRDDVQVQVDRALTTFTVPQYCPRDTGGPGLGEQTRGDARDPGPPLFLACLLGQWEVRKCVHQGHSQAWAVPGVVCL